MLKRVLLFGMILLTMISVGQNHRKYLSRYDICTGFAYAKCKQVTIGDLNPTGSPSHVKSMDTLTASNNSSFGPFAGIALNFPFLQRKESSLGIHAGVSFYVTDGGFALSFPMMLQFRTGTDAVLESQKNVGFAISAGFNPFLANSDGMGEGIFCFPSVSPELNFASNKYGLFKIRVYAQFGTKSGKRKFENEIHYSQTKIPLILCVGICPRY